MSHQAFGTSRTPHHSMIPSGCCFLSPFPGTLGSLLTSTSRPDAGFPPRPRLRLRPMRLTNPGEVTSTALCRMSIPPGKDKEPGDRDTACRRNRYSVISLEKPIFFPEKNLEFKNFTDGIKTTKSQVYSRMLKMHKQEKERMKINPSPLT